MVSYAVKQMERQRSRWADGGGGSDGVRCVNDAGSDCSNSARLPVPVWRRYKKWR